MEKQGYNPYLPSWEYIPDGEPHVYGDRVYLFGSHDRFGSEDSCLNDYVCYSAPVWDLREWTYEGVIYGRSDDPKNADGKMCMYAPDVCRGPDGRYYLYYVLSDLNYVSVAVSSTPAGRYTFYGYVHYEDGTLFGSLETDEMPFDPGVYVEEDRVYLYTGGCPPEWTKTHGAMVTVLKSDMLTIAEKPRTIVPSKPYCSGTSFAEHAFYEAPSMRKNGSTYYFVYSSVWLNELCYATSDSPVEGFVYGGVIVSNVDKGIGHYKEADRMMAFPDNNHGSIEQVDGNWYIFYHRHTNGTSHSRQACMERIQVLGDGRIPQVEITSCGSNGGPLSGHGYYPAYIACHIYGKTDWSKRISGQQHSSDMRFPFVTQDQPDGETGEGYVTNLTDGSGMGFKYFACKAAKLTGIRVRGQGKGVFQIKTALEGSVIGQIPVEPTRSWTWHEAEILIPDGIQSLYLEYEGLGSLELGGFELV